MRCDLMHKDIPVAELDIDDADGSIGEIIHVLDVDRLPVGSVVDGDVRRDRLKAWWSGRSIPVTRSGIAHLMRALDLDSTGPLLSRSMGLSLSDHYWIRPSDTNVSWDEVNFFDNGFSDDLGDLLFGKDVWVGEMDFRSPDSTSDGLLRKRWKIIGGRRCLIKSGTSPYMQEPFNEVIASRLAEMLGIPAVECRIMEYEGTPCSVCDDFVTKDTELVSAQQVMRSEIHEPGISPYNHLISCCSHHGIDIVPFLDRMLTLDYIIANGDRHFNNFGILATRTALNGWGRHRSTTAGPVSASIWNRRTSSTMQASPASRSQIISESRWGMSRTCHGLTWVPSAQASPRPGNSWGPWSATGRREWIR